MPKNKTSLACWDSIRNMPISNWFKVEESNDIGHMLKRYRKVTQDEIPVLFKKWLEIVDEFIDEFGISDEMLRVLMIKKSIRIMEIDEELFGQNNQTFIEIEKLKLQELSKAGQKESNAAITAYLESEMKFPIDEDKTPVIKYYSYIRLMKKKYESAAQRAEFRK